MSLKWLPNRNRFWEFQQCFKAKYLPVAWERKAMYTWGPEGATFWEVLPSVTYLLQRSCLESVSMPLNAIRSESRPSLELRLAIYYVNRHFVFTQWWETASRKGQAIRVGWKDLELSIYTDWLWVQIKSYVTELLFNFQNLNPKPIALVFFFFLSL